MSDYCAELMLKEPLTKKDWEMIADADFKYTSKVTFTTPHCGEVEFVKVVRCKDCKNMYEDVGGTVCVYGAFVDCITPNDFYCSFGERREDAD